MSGITVSRQDTPTNTNMLSDMRNWYNAGACIVLYDNQQNKANAIFHHCAALVEQFEERVQASAKEFGLPVVLTQTIDVPIPSRNFDIIHFNFANEASLTDPKTTLVKEKCRECACNVLKAKALGAQLIHVKSWVYGVDNLWR